MSCNHCATASAAVAARHGAPDIEANWAANRQHPEICPVCRNSFRRADGGCTKCDNSLVEMAQKNPARYIDKYKERYFAVPVMRDLAPTMVMAEDGEARRVAAGYLTDPALLDELSRNGTPAVQAAVAANSNTPPAALHHLLGSADRRIYRAAAFNPVLPVSAIDLALKETNERWQELVQKALQPLLYGRAFRGGKGGWLLPSLLVGMYGPAICQHWRRKRDLEQAREQTRRNPPPRPATPGEVARLAPSLPTPAVSDKRLNDREMRALLEELKLAESGLELAEDYFDGQITQADVARIQRNGVATDRDAEIAGHLLEQAAETARKFPGWHDDLAPADFEQMLFKLRCKKCGLYAGSAGPTCNYQPQVGEKDETKEPAGGVTPVDVYKTR